MSNSSKAALARDVWVLMFDFLMRTSPQRARSLGRCGLTPNDARALAALDPLVGRTMRSLADDWECDASNATWIVDRLERLGLARNVRSGVALHMAPGRTFVLAFGALGLAYAATALAQTLLTPFIGAWSEAVAILRAVGSDDGRLEHAGPGLAAIILLRACLLAPFVEELLFRGVLFGWLRQRLSASLTIAVTSVAFAAIHVYASILPLAFATGVALGWIRERSNSTAPTIVAHVVHNVLVVTFAYATAGWGARLPS